MKRKNQRAVLLLLSLVAMAGAALLAMSALKDQASYFYAPGDVARQGIPLGRAVRIGGMVREGSVRRSSDGVTVDFVVGDETPSTIRVRYRGILPDLFREKSGVVAQGRFRRDGLFAADEILARHDENYMPPQLAPRKGEHKTDTLK